MIYDSYENILNQPKMCAACTPVVLKTGMMDQIINSQAFVKVLNDPMSYEARQDSVIGDYGGIAAM